MASEAAPLLEPDLPTPSSSTPLHPLPSLPRPCTVWSSSYLHWHTSPLALEPAGQCRPSCWCLYFPCCHNVFYGMFVTTCAIAMVAAPVHKDFAKNKGSASYTTSFNALQALCWPWVWSYKELVDIGSRWKYPFLSQDDWEEAMSSALHRIQRSFIWLSHLHHNTQIIHCWAAHFSMRINWFILQCNPAPGGWISVISTLW